MKPTYDIHYLRRNHLQQPVYKGVPCTNNNGSKAASKWHRLAHCIGLQMACYGISVIRRPLPARVIKQRYFRSDINWAFLLFTYPI